MSHPTDPALNWMRELMRDWIGDEDTPDHDQLEGIFYALTQDADLREMWDRHLKAQVALAEEDMHVLESLACAPEKPYGALVTGDV